MEAMEGPCEESMGPTETRYTGMSSPEGSRRGESLLRGCAASARQKGNIAEKADSERVGHFHRLLPKECLIFTKVNRQVPNGMLVGVRGMNNPYSI